jgi:uncharacterized protein
VNPEKWKKSMLIPVNELPPGGAQFILDDQALWLSSIDDFGMNCAVTSPLAAGVTVIPAKTGCLVHGRLTGKIVMPCNRCAEDSSISIASYFEEFELSPDGDSARDGEESRIITQNGIPILDLAAICWEEFVLSLPAVPLCSPDCKGGCPGCRTNLNNAACVCMRDEPDSRFAVLLGLKLDRKSR